MNIKTITVDDLCYEYILALAETIKAKGFSKEKKMQEAVTYICERAAWLEKNSDNIYTKIDTKTEKGKLVKVNIKTQ